MASFHLGQEEEEDVMEAEEGEQQASALLADALMKMDGLIGDYQPESDSDPLAEAIAAECEKLMALIAEGEEEEEVEGRNRRNAVPLKTRTFLTDWLTHKKTQEGSLQQYEQLQRDKTELLRQVVDLQGDVEEEKAEGQRLRQKVTDLQKQLVEKDDHCQSLSEELRTIKTELTAREGELRKLQAEVQASLRGNQGLHPIKESGHRKHVTLVEPMSAHHPRRSIRKSLAKAFSRKKAHTATLNTSMEIDASALPREPLNARAADFYSLDGDGLSSWFDSIGLDMYCDIAKQNIATGERMATIASLQGNEELVRAGIVSTLHCKKLRLAVEEALCEQASPLETLGHRWVAEWLGLIGLPQYTRTFSEARIDGRMLNSISMEDLDLLDVVTPFHIVSIRRALLAFRMCGYNPNYLKDGDSKGSQKLLHWSAAMVTDWIKSIELEEYAGALDSMGINGAVMLLEETFTSESLARVLGIGPSKALLHKHLGRKFMEVIGPVAAQKKLDSMAAKTFQPIDPTWQPKSHRGRSRSTSMRRKGSSQRTENLLCPLDEFPASDFTGRGVSVSPPQEFDKFDRPPTP